MEKKFSPKAWKSLFEFILSTKGESHPVYGRRYQDEKVAIYEKTLSGGGLTVERVENHNPVIVFHDPNPTPRARQLQNSNEYLRYHGEFRFIESHLRYLAACQLWPEAGEQPGIESVEG